MTGLYIHIPFCVKKCGYCDFLSFEGQSQDLMQDYVNALIDQCNGKQALQIGTVFIGGGTPSILPEGEIMRIMSAVSRRYLIDSAAEISIEINPGTLTEQKAYECSQAGINRMSIGLQSTDNGLLAAIGRIHTFEDFLYSYEIARKHFKNINIDLMYGLPNQTANQYEDTLQKVIGLNPEHISAYSLILEEGTKFYECCCLADESTLEEMDRLNQMLNTLGYAKYEISNYAKQGYTCKHNINYWRLGEYDALGLGATSMLRADGMLVRNTCTKNMNDYLINHSLLESSETVSNIEEAFEYIMMGLRMTDGISLSEYKDRFGTEFQKKSNVKGLIDQHLLIIEGDRAFLSERGLDIQNIILQTFMN